MKKIIIIISLAVMVSMGFAQAIYNSDARIVSSTGSYWVVDNGDFTLTSASPANLAQMANLTITGDASLTLSADTYLTVSGTLANNNGASFTARSNASGTGSLIVSGSLINNGIINMERYIAGWSDANHGWHFLSSPVDAQAISDFHTAGSGNDFYKWDEPTAMWINRTAEGGVLNPGFETEFEVGKGYLMANATNGTMVFTGNLNVNDVTVNGLNFTTGSLYRGWNLTGNPYSSALAWNNGHWTLGDVASNCQMWDEANASYTVIEPNGHIPSMNGFMVYTDVNETSLIIPASARTHSNTPWYKQSASGSPRLVLKAADPAGSTVQKTTIALNPMATESYDNQFDSYFLAGFAPMFYSIGQGCFYALNALPELSAESIIPLGFIKNNNSAFAISIESNETGLTPYLTDKKLNLTQNLNSGSYLFTSGIEDVSDRFLLRFANATGIDEQVSSLKLWINDHMLYINAPGMEGEKAMVDVCNAAGQVLFSRQMTLNSMNTLLLNATGPVVARVVTPKGVVTIKAVLMN